MRIYLDSSAYLKGFIEESQSGKVTEILNKCKAGRLTVVISVWTLSECISVLDKALNKRISPDQMDSIATKMLAYAFNFEKEGKLDIVEPDGKMIYRSWAYIRWYHLSADDALHTICATVGQSDALVMADGRFASMLKNPEKMDDPRILAQRPRIEFKVLDLFNDKDCRELEGLIKSL